VREALIRLGQADWQRIVVTNQPDIAYGTLPLGEYEKIMSALRELPVDDVFVCPHGRDDGCACKKPKPGLLLDAAAKWDINLTASIMIGDSQSDVEAGQAAGCQTLHIPSQAGNLEEAVDIILSR
jgi:D-glycero-D-manno-heptose 1,7-bisphosphate phosphatase